ncbi:cob(I)yrinic acid a,c-diamide adenosyltransferase [Candidatus Uhrbacteria bacterium]|nr:cob(I)yrinic acid a,c-diamide adenosyltransferase [Candidatus Uhrbacteria bacterium]
MGMLHPREQKWGMIQVFTGNGKGKTTTALGTVIRAVAKQKRVAIIYFDKGGENHYSEREFIRARISEIDLFPTGLDRIDPITNAFRFGVTAEDQKEGERGLCIVRDLFEKNKHQLIVLDEINSSTHLGIIKEAVVLDVLDQRPPHIELILTGRDAPQSFKDRADLVTEMMLVKHYFYRGIAAREGLDY